MKEGDGAGKEKDSPKKVKGGTKGHGKEEAEQEETGSAKKERGSFFRRSSSRNKGKEMHQDGGGEVQGTPA